MTALSDLCVLDLSTHVAGPFCTKLLADFGAEVMKLEPLQGDPSRQMGPVPPGISEPEASALFLYLHTNKRGVTLNLDTAMGRHLLHALG